MNMIETVQVLIVTPCAQRGRVLALFICLCDPTLKGKYHGKIILLPKSIPYGWVLFPFRDTFPLNFNTCQNNSLMFPTHHLIIAQP